MLRMSNWLWDFTYIYICMWTNQKNESTFISSAKSFAFTILFRTCKIIIKPQSVSAYIMNKSNVFTKQINLLYISISGWQQNYVKYCPDVLSFFKVTEIPVSSVAHLIGVSFGKSRFISFSFPPSSFCLFSFVCYTLWVK